MCLFIPLLNIPINKIQLITFLVVKWHVNNLILNFKFIQIIHFKNPPSLQIQVNKKSSEWKILVNRLNKKKVTSNDSSFFSIINTQPIFGDDLIINICLKEKNAIKWDYFAKVFWKPKHSTSSKKVKKYQEKLICSSNDRIFAKQFVIALSCN